MHLQIFAYIYPNSWPGRKYNLSEDAVAVSKDKTVFAVADGITQLSYTKKELKTGRSKAKDVAEIFCKTILSSGGTVREMLERANRKIRKYNRGAKPDFWKTDYTCCTGAVCIVWKETLEYGYIGDAFVGVLGKRGWKLPVQDSYKAVHDFWKPIKSSELREFITRALLRNRPGTFDMYGRDIGYGALTGETSALKTLRTGKVRLERGDVIVIGSDGVLPFFRLGNFLRALRSGTNVGKILRDAEGNKKELSAERTLVMVRVV